MLEPAKPKTEDEIFEDFLKGNLSEKEYLKELNKIKKT
jgi:hypothetical protein